MSLTQKLKIKNLENLKVSTRLYAMAFTVIVGFIVFSWLFFNTINTVKVHGPIYKSIIEGKDLVADILPPPEYIIESYLLVLESSETDDLSVIDGKFKRFLTLKEEYYTRHRYWIEVLDESKLKEQLTIDSYLPANEFFAIAEGKYFPLLLTNKADSARLLLKNELKPRYENHRSFIDKVVIGANNRNTQNEIMAKDLMSSRFGLLVIVGVIIIVGTLALCFVLIKQLLNQLGGEPGEVKDITNQIANGNLLIQFDPKRANKGIYGALASMTYRLKELIGSVHSASESITIGMLQINQVTQDISQGASEQAASLEEISTALDEFAANALQNTENAHHTKREASSAVETIEFSASDIGSLGEAVKRISEKTAVVTAIASQTNILALNAAIEASRAGVHGRGFAVVSAEVRRLAEQCRVMAEEISDITHQNASIAETTTTRFTGVVPKIYKTSELINEIAMSSSEQSTGINHINQSVILLSRVTQQNAAGAEEMASSIEELTEQTEQLKKLVSVFTVK